MRKIIFIIVVLVIVISVCLFKILQNEKEIEVVSNFDDFIDQNVIATELLEKFIIDKPEESVVIESQEIENEQNTIIDEVIETSELQITSEIKEESSSQASSTVRSAISNTENKQGNQEVITEPQIPEVESTTIAVSTTIQETKESEVTEEKQEIVIQTSQNTNIEKEEKNEVYVPVENTENYITNSTLTSTIIDIINKNPSETMIQYGYTVVIDESIISLTNPFTFSEQRIKNKIQNKAGTIKLYVRDYYLNGTCIETQCYIY